MLETLLQQRCALLNSPQAPQLLLRQLDRRLLLWCEHHPEELGGEAWQPKEIDEDAAPLAALWLELSLRLNGKTPSDAKAGSAGVVPASVAPGCYWRLVACYSDLALPDRWPERREDELWAAMAMARRGQIPECSVPWSAWIKWQFQPEDSKQATLTTLLPELWRLAPESWPEWFYPLMLAVPEDSRPAMINWLAGCAEDVRVIEAMGISGCARFEPWLQDMAEQDLPVGTAAKEELQRMKAARTGILDVRARYRHWWANWLQLQGAPWSLWGGQW